MKIILEFTPFNMDSTSLTTSQLLVSSPCSLKRKASTLVTSNETCSICLHGDAVLQTKECGHLFHTRCVASWPMVTCPTCYALVSSVSIVNVNLDEKPPAVRSGTWVREEENFVAGIIAIYEDLAFPLSEGTSIRTLLARLLNCTPMRVSKKFQKHPLGKHTYYSCTKNRFDFNAEEHATKMRHLSTLESAFRSSIALKYNYENGDSEVEDLSIASRQFWAQQFLFFVTNAKQSVEGIDISSLKPNKGTLKMLRAGQYGEVITLAQEAREKIETPSEPFDFVSARTWKYQDTKHLPSIHCLLAPTLVNSKMLFKKGRFDGAKHSRSSLLLAQSNPWKTMDFIPARTCKKKSTKHSISSLLAPTTSGAISDPLTLDKSKDAPYNRGPVSPDHLDYFIRYNPSHKNDWITLV